jgi:integrase
MASIAKRPDGQWRARYRDEGGKEHSQHFRRKVDAQEWLDRVVTSVVTGAYVDPRAGRITFKDFYEQWHERQVWVPGTRRAMDIAAGSVTFATVPLKSIRRSHVEQLVKTMETRQLMASTIHTRTNNVRAVLRAAVLDRVIPTDPSIGVTLPRRRRAEAAMTIPTTSEIGKVLKAADGPFRAYVALCAFAGLRVGEAAGVQVGDIDFLRRTLTVSRQIQREARRLRGKSSEVREREVDLSGSSPGVHDDGSHCGLPPGQRFRRWLFIGEGEDPPHQNTVTHRWAKTRTAAGLENLKMHDCRHFYASGLIAHGADVVTVQRALGHAKATTTLNTYSHLWPTAEDRTRQAAEAMLTEALSAEENEVPADSVRTSGPS